MELITSSPNISEPPIKYGWLTMVGEKYYKYYGGINRVFADFVCDCGKSYSGYFYPVKMGKIKSCGCKKREILAGLKTTHGLSNIKKTRPIYDAWVSMKGRCYGSDERCKRYRELEIEVCKEWIDSYVSFYEWSIDNNWRKGLSLDRIDNNCGYNPHNCRWTTSKVQNRNKSTNRNITAFGETKCMADWLKDKRCKVPHTTLFYRFRSGRLSPELAISMPPQKYKGDKGRRNVKNTTHGMTIGKKAHPILKAWYSMRERCYNKESYSNHYAGIEVCKEWRESFDSFRKWAEYGWKKGLSLDRINNNGDYKPSNCRWTTVAEQNRNKSNNIYLTAFDEVKTASEWVRDNRCHVNVTTLINRVKYSKWEHQKAITQPSKKIIKCQL